eukprot:14430197-Alexandrium_andersonii.AAC.1
MGSSPRAGVLLARCCVGADEVWPEVERWEHLSMRTPAACLAQQATSLYAVGPLLGRAAGRGIGRGRGETQPFSYLQ